MNTSETRSRTAVGLWVGLTVVFLLASLAMVQVRCKVTGGFPCGDWPKESYTCPGVPAGQAVLPLPEPAYTTYEEALVARKVVQERDVRWFSS